jgi:zinc transport system permease protein
MDILQYDFMRHALLAGLLVSIAGGIVGTIVVLNRMVFISAGIAHAAYGGIGIGYFFGINPLFGALGFSVMAALGMGLIERNTRQRTDTLIGVMWAVGMAIGIILIDRTEGYKADLLSYLFGSILFVNAADLWIMAGLDVVLLVLAVVAGRLVLAMSFDETFTAIRNVPVERIYLVLVCLIAITVVLMMRLVGLILVIALLTMPAAIASLFTRNLFLMMAVAIGLSMAFTTAGLFLAAHFDLTSGAAIILLAAVVYLGAAVGPKSVRTPHN